MAASWSRLPDEISERVLSFLPVPALCRCRSVCRKWNELVRKQRFLDLCDQNGTNRANLFVTRYGSYGGYNACQSFVDNEYQQPLCFLDLEERRWYSIPADAPDLLDDELYVLLLLALDHGLVCELSSSGECYKLVMVDPFTKARRELPASTSDGKTVCCDFGDRDPKIDDLPVIVTVVDDVDHSFKVILLNRDCCYAEEQTGLFVYESSMDTWRSLETPAEELAVGIRQCLGRMLEESAVFFQGALYAMYRIDGSYDETIIVSYSVEKNLWSEVVAVGVNFPEERQLIVSGNRMFVAIWSDHAQCHILSSYTPFFEIREIFVDKRLSTSLVKISNEDLEHTLGEAPCDIQYGFPLSGDSVVLFSRRTGSLFTYDLTTKALDALPAHRLQLSEHLDVYRQITPHYRAKLSKLSLRNILSVRRP